MKGHGLVPGTRREEHRGGQWGTGLATLRAVGRASAGLVTLSLSYVSDFSTLIRVIWFEVSVDLSSYSEPPLLPRLLSLAALCSRLLPASVPADLHLHRWLLIPCPHLTPCSRNRSAGLFPVWIVFHTLTSRPFLKSSLPLGTPTPACSSPDSPFSLLGACAPWPPARGWAPPVSL